MVKKEFQIGYIMPISDTDGYSASHWVRVREILDDVVKDFQNSIENIEVVSLIVSENSNEQNIIQKNIVQNLYNSDLVICDTSSKNPNVMFELGMRLAFDKKIIIIKDDITGYNFDTSPIKHIPYNKDLEYTGVKKFKKQLVEEIKKNYESENENGGYLSAFSNITVKAVSTTEVGEADALNKILLEINTLHDKVNDVNKQITTVNRESRASLPRSKYQMEDRRLIKNDLNHMKKKNMDMQKRNMDVYESRFKNKVSDRKNNSFLNDDSFISED